MARDVSTILTISCLVHHQWGPRLRPQRFRRLGSPRPDAGRRSPLHAGLLKKATASALARAKWAGSRARARTGTTVPEPDPRQRRQAMYELLLGEARAAPLDLEGLDPG
jgi:hypothetical protein